MYLGWRVLEGGTYIEGMQKEGEIEGDDEEDDFSTEYTEDADRSPLERVLCHEDVVILGVVEDFF